jgi:hypothetical protein
LQNVLKNQYNRVTVLYNSRKSCPLGWILLGRKPVKKNMSKWIFRGRIIA